MSKSLRIVLVFLLIFSTYSTFHKVESASKSCTLTSEQGYTVGSAIGNSETYPSENYQLYINTVNDFSGCGLYVMGVTEGYEATRYGQPGNQNF